MDERMGEMVRSVAPTIILMVSPRRQHTQLQLWAPATPRSAQHAMPTPRGRRPFVDSVRRTRTFRPSGRLGPQPLPYLTLGALLNLSQCALQTRSC
eukprot:11311730-Alexandrium_andersonii.AAC.1